MSTTRSTNGQSFLGLAIVGCGQIATHHLSAIAALSDRSNQLDLGDCCNEDYMNLGSRKQSFKFCLRALVDPSSYRRDTVQKLSSSQFLMIDDELEHNQHGILRTAKCYDRLTDLLCDEKTMESINVIFIAVPHDLHEALAIEALEYKSNNSDKCITIVLEKPLAPTFDACERLVLKSNELFLNSTNSDAKSNMLIIAEQSPYWEEVVLAKKLIQNNEIGTVLTASSYYYESMKNNVTSGSVEDSGGLGWRGSLKRAGGGIVIDGGLHWIRPLSEMLSTTATSTQPMATQISASSSSVNNNDKYVAIIHKVIGVTQSSMVLQPELRMEGESLAHAIFDIHIVPMDTPSDVTAVQQDPQQANSHKPKSHSILATYSANMVSRGVMAYDTCPYFRITGSSGEIVIFGSGLQHNTPGAGGLKLYNSTTSDTGKNMLDPNRIGGFFLGFQGLWTEILRIIEEHDYKAAHTSVVKASNDVKVALALYRSNVSGTWEQTNATVPST